MMTPVRDVEWATGCLVGSAVRDWMTAFFADRGSAANQILCVALKENLFLLLDCDTRERKAFGFRGGHATRAKREEKTDVIEQR
ncbi:hypothetical protein [Burkholderia sp. Cy-637]|uniref:hypothetical protein n=1 Tax=Burkholderia sp. Cy-637 TaxID=2608327 RepID=UPI00142471FC|nr:hypothetical protein [Burkholderia sp. Cy-637]NIF90438.1 hypothetical protein [Burkholderia sp. Cy-637]